MLLRCGFFNACSGYRIWTERLRSFRNGKGKTNTSEDYTKEETTIFWTLNTRERKTKITDGRKYRRDKTQRKAKKNVDK